MIQMMTRRSVMAMGAAGLAGGVLLGGGLGQGTAEVLAQEGTATPVENVTTDGIGGGGTVSTGYGDATFALTAFALPGVDGQPVFNGGFTLSDPQHPDEPIAMVAQFFNQITAFSTAQPNAREIVGWATVNERGPYPFVLQVEDIGPAGSGQDTFNLVFGNDALPFIHTDAKKCDCGGFTYTLRGTVVQGDLVRFPITTANAGQ